MPPHDTITTISMVKKSTDQTDDKTDDQTDDKTDGVVLPYKKKDQLLILSSDCWCEEKRLPAVSCRMRA